MILWQNIYMIKLLIATRIKTWNNFLPYHIQTFDMQIWAGKNDYALIMRKFTFINFCFGSHKEMRTFLLKIFAATVINASHSPKNEVHSIINSNVFIFFLIGLDFFDSFFSTKWHHNLKPTQNGIKFETLKRINVVELKIL